MSIKVLVVDDSSFFRRRVSEILNQDADLEVIATANDGRDAVEKAKLLLPDVITMDVEMPVLDGISAVREILKHRRVPILMFSSLTHQGAKATLDALEAGAADFLPKKFEDIARDKQEATVLLQQRVKAIAKRAPTRALGTPLSDASSLRVRTPLTATPIAPVTARSRVTSRPGQYKLLAIGTSTGGPVALQTILTQFPQNFPLPILLIQHMPAAFTPAFAQRLNSLCKITVVEAKDGDVLQPGTAYLAPGGKQMLIDGSVAHAKLRILEDNSPRITYKPSVDITFGSSAKVFGGNVLAVVLTGMGADGREGSRLLKDAGSKIWAQDEKSCVVYGMPQAVFSAGIAEHEFALSDMASNILKELAIG